MKKKAKSETTKGAKTVTKETEKKFSAASAPSAVSPPAPSAADLDAQAAESQAAAATAGEASAESVKPADEIESSAPSAPSAVKEPAGRRVKVLRSNALYGELGVAVEEYPSGQVRVKLSGPVFVNDPGVTLQREEYEFLD